VVPASEVPEPVSAVAVKQRERPEAAHRAGRVFSGEDVAAQLVTALRADGVL